MYNDFIKKNNLYFSDYYDLSNKFPDNIFYNNQDLKSIIKQQFCWNFHQLSSMKISLKSENKNTKDMSNNSSGKIENNLSIEKEEWEIIPPIINGYMEIKKIEEYEKEFVFILVARRDIRRTGTRYLCRGADEDGCCANFVETEQIILIYDKYHTVLGDFSYQAISHIQVRGSIPVRWSQPANFKLVPKVNFY